MQGVNEIGELLVEGNLVACVPKVGQEASLKKEMFA